MGLNQANEIVESIGGVTGLTFTDSSTGCLLVKETLSVKSSVVLCNISV